MSLFERSHILLGDTGIERLQDSHVVIAGVGGVGSYAAEAIARLGVGKITLIDHDTVSSSNINRQLIALQSTLDQYKTEVMAARIKDINPHCQVICQQTFIDQANLPKLIAQPPHHYDSIIDAIDSLTSKTDLLAYCVSHTIPVFSSMGAGGKTDPNLISEADLMDTSVCKLARQLRQRLKKRGIGKGIKTVYSTEVGLPPLPPQPVERGRPRAINGTVSYMPALFGLRLAGLVAKQLLNK